MEGLEQYTNREIAEELFSRCKLSDVLFKFSEDEEVIEYVRNHIYIDSDIIDARGMPDREKLLIVFAALEIKQAFPDKEYVFNELIKLGL
jgi:hypothetical protein